MRKPTPEQMARWRNAALASHLADLQNGKRLSDIAGITERVAVLAAIWARNQALDDAANAILSFNPVSPSHFCEASEIANLVLSLKGASK